MTYYILLLIGVWIVCGIFVFGLSFAYWQRHYVLSAKTYLYSDFWFSFFIGLVFGPIGLLLYRTHLLNGIHGFKWLPILDGDLNDRIRKDLTSEYEEETIKLALRLYGN